MDRIVIRIAEYARSRLKTSSMQATVDVLMPLDG
jgi:hypothetical protein